MKKCNGCGELKEFTEFHKDCNAKDGLYTKCKSCKGIYVKNKYRSNPEKYKEIRKNNYYANIDKEREEAIIRSKEWRKNNPDKRNALKAKYKADKIKATPKWANLEKIAEFYTTATALGMHTGEWFHVDHIVPLRNKFVCGLHNEFNLQILTAKENMKKNNHFEVLI